MRCLVIGAGLLGITTAWFLRRHGIDVVVCDRQPGPGRETSFANGGMLHASQANPWNEPGVLLQVLRTLGREDSALLIRPRALVRMLPWALQFFRNATPARFAHAAARNTRLADYSIAVLNEHLGPLALDFGRADRGTLKIYRTDNEFRTAQEATRVSLAAGVRATELSADGVVALEPALGPIADELSGGIHFPDDVSGDAHRFCVALAAEAAAAGVAFHYESTVEAISVVNRRFAAARIDGIDTAFDACVIAAGSYSASLARSAGLRLPVQPVKGYSLTLPLAAWDPQPRVPVIDEHFHAAVCPLGDSLRVAGTAEFAGHDAALRAGRINNLFELVRQVYPDAAARIDRAQATQWCGFRPMTPDGVGVISATQVAGLYINSGHGHLGWTMAPGAGKLLADLVAGTPEELTAEDYALSRF